MTLGESPKAKNERGRPRTKNGRLREPGCWLDVGSTSCARPGHQGSGQKRPMAGGSSFMERLKKSKGRRRDRGGAAGAGGQGTRSANGGEGGSEGRRKSGWVGRLDHPLSHHLNRRVSHGVSQAATAQRRGEAGGGGAWVAVR